MTLVPSLKHIGLIGAGATALAAAAGAGVWHRLVRRPLPRTTGTLRVPGLEAPVEIARDRWGVPHVRARSMPDAWFGQGFCHAQDRLWQLDLYRRFSSGRLAEIAGTEGLAADRFVRTLGLRRAALAEEAALGGELKTAMEAYAAGVNAAVAIAPAPPFELQVLRIEFEPWRPADTLTITKLLALGLSTNWERELLRADMVRALGPELAARLDPGYPAGNPIALEPGVPWSGDGLALAEQIAALRSQLGLVPEATGSNNWAVAPARSATGGALLAGDPHLSPSMPGITYQLGVYVGERFCRGASFPGRIGIAFGQNNDVAWSFTNTMADVMDLFVERVDGDAYEFEGERRQLELVEEEIAVRGRSQPMRLVGPSHPSRPDRQRGAAGRPGRAARARLDGAGRSLRHRGLPRRARGGQRPRAGRLRRAPQRAGLEPRLGRSPWVHRLQDDRAGADPPRWLSGPPEAGLDRRL